MPRGRPREHQCDADKQYEYRKRRADELMLLRSAAAAAEKLLATLTAGDAGYTDRSRPLHQRLNDLEWSTTALPQFKR